MVIDEVIRAHVAWRAKLSSYLRKRDGTLKASEIEVDGRCELGRWIAGEGTAHAASPEFGAVRVLHARFHRCAADVVRKADADKDVSEEVVLGGSSAYGMVSTDLVGALRSMRARLGQ